MFGDTRTGILLLITHILACLSVGILFRFWKRKKVSSIKFRKTSVDFIAQKEINFANLGEILTSSILTSIQTILLIGGFVVLFSVIISILNHSHVFSILSSILQTVFRLLNIDSMFCNGILTGIIELTSGIKAISLVPIKSISQSVTISSFLLGFGGFCVLLQTFSIVAKSHISLKPYIIGKVLHGIFAALYTYLFLNIFPIFNLDIG